MTRTVVVTRAVVATRAVAATPEPGAWASRRTGNHVLALALSVALSGLGCGESATTAPTSPLAVELRSVSPELGWVVCSTRDLTACTARAYFRHSTRTHPTTDVRSTRDCAALEAHARTTCHATPGDPPSRDALACLASHGVFLDIAARDEPARDDHPAARFELVCAEGRAHVDVIEPM